jgi:hypothetical protein
LLLDRFHRCDGGYGGNGHWNTSNKETSSLVLLVLVLLVQLKGPVRFHEVLVVVKNVYDTVLTLNLYDASRRIDVASPAVPKLVFIVEMQVLTLLRVKGHSSRHSNVPN